MLTASPTQKPLESIIDTLDSPVQHTLLLARRSLWTTFLVGFVGAFLIALSTWATRVLQFGVGMKHDTLLALFVAIAVVFPSASIVAVYLGIIMSPRVQVAAIAIALVVSGAVACSTMPLMAFLVLVSSWTSVISFEVVIPIVAAGAIAATISRITRVLDPRPRARAFAIVCNVAFIATFGLRALSLV